MNRSVIVITLCRPKVILLSGGHWIFISLIFRQSSNFYISHIEAYVSKKDEWLKRNAIVAFRKSKIQLKDIDQRIGILNIRTSYWNIYFFLYSVNPNDQLRIAPTCLQQRPPFGGTILNIYSINGLWITTTSQLFWGPEINRWTQVWLPH